VAIAIIFVRRRKIKVIIGSQSIAGHSNVFIGRLRSDCLVIYSVYVLTGVLRHVRKLGDQLLLVKALCG